MRQLIDFDRTHIKAGATKTVSFDVPYDLNALRYWDEEKYEFVVEPGAMELQVGASSADIKLKKQIQIAV
jgi:beta-glucosidase